MDEVLKINRPGGCCYEPGMGLRNRLPGSNALNLEPLLVALTLLPCLLRMRHLVTVV